MLLSHRKRAFTQAYCRRVGGVFQISTREPSEAAERCFPVTCWHTSAGVATAPFYPCTFSLIHFRVSGACTLFASDLHSLNEMHASAGHSSAADSGSRNGPGDKGVAAICRAKTPGEFRSLQQHLAHEELAPLLIQGYLGVTK